MPFNTPPKVVTIPIKRPRSSTDATNKRPTSHKKSKIPIEVKVEELKSTKCTTKKTLFKQAKKQVKHIPFILPPVTKQSPELDTKVVRPKLGDKVDVSSNFTSTLTRTIRSHCGSIQKEKIATKVLDNEFLRCQIY